MTARRRASFAERRDERAAIDDPEIVLAAALRFLEARARSVAEVRRRLTTAGYRTELVDRAVSRLCDLGILDDATFARSWIESRDRARPRGERALRQELQLKGIDRVIVDELLAERSTPSADEPDADATGARRVLERHAAALGRVADPRHRWQRAYALLARSGFDPDTASTAVRTFLAAGATGDGEDDEQAD